MDCWWCGENCSGSCDKRPRWGSYPKVFEAAHGLPIRPPQDLSSEQERLDAAARVLEADRREVERMLGAQRDHERLLALREEQLALREQDLARRAAELDAQARRVRDLDHKLRTWAEAHDLINADVVPMHDRVERGTRVG